MSTVDFFFGPKQGLMVFFGKIGCKTPLKGGFCYRPLNKYVFAYTLQFYGNMLLDTTTIIIFDFSVKLTRKTTLPSHDANKLS